MLTLYHILGRIFRFFPKQKKIQLLDMQADFFVPVNCHYICEDLKKMDKGSREPFLYDWLNGLEPNAVLFDVGTNYGQEVTLVSSLLDKNLTVVGFDCNLYHSHFCCLNKALNKDRFEFVFAAIAERSGEQVTITTNSDTHIPHLHKKNVPYSYVVSTLALDDYANTQKRYPTHLKIDVDGAEIGVIKGAKQILSSDQIKEIFIEIDNQNSELVDMLKGYGFEIVWKYQKDRDCDMLFRKISGLKT